MVWIILLVLGQCCIVRDTLQLLCSIYIYGEHIVASLYFRTSFLPSVTLLLQFLIAPSILYRSLSYLACRYLAWTSTFWWGLRSLGSRSRSPRLIIDFLKVTFFILFFHKINPYIDKASLGSIHQFYWYPCFIIAFIFWYVFYFPFSYKKLLTKFI